MTALGPPSVSGAVDKQRRQQQQIPLAQLHPHPVSRRSSFSEATTLLESLSVAQGLGEEERLIQEEQRRLQRRKSVGGASARLQPPNGPSGGRKSNANK